MILGHSTAQEPENRITAENFDSKKLDEAVSGLHVGLKLTSFHVVVPHLRAFYDAAVAALHASEEYQKQKSLEARLADIRDVSQQAEAANQNARKAFEDAVSRGDEAAIAKARSEWLKIRGAYNPDAAVAETEVVNRLIQENRGKVTQRWMQCLAVQHGILRERCQKELQEAQQTLRQAFTGEFLDALGTVHGCKGILDIVGRSLHDFESWHRGAQIGGHAGRLMPFVPYQQSIFSEPA